jgi:8-oxo-dGTP diphosphatase
MPNADAQATDPWLPKAGDPIPVLAAVITRSDRLLICERPAEKRHGSLWEFPGGKLEPGESYADAARRELREELGVAVASVGPILFRRYEDGANFEIVFVAVSIEGEPIPTEHSDLAWVEREEILARPLAPCDHAFAIYLTQSSKALEPQ